MDVRCEKCLTVYDFDEAQVTEAGVTVKCTQCGHLFRVRRRAQPTDKGVGSPGRPATPAAVTVPDAGKVWLLRRARTGEVLRIRELTTLQQWIVERRVGRDDEISKTGETWKPLGGIPELAPFFQVVEQAQAGSAVEGTPPRGQQRPSRDSQSTLPWQPGGSGRIDAQGPTMEADAPTARTPARVSQPRARTRDPEDMVRTVPRPVITTPTPLPMKHTPSPTPVPARRDPSAQSYPSFPELPEPPTPPGMSLRADAAGDDFEDDELDRLPRRGPSGKLVVSLLLLFAVGIGGMFAWRKGAFKNLLGGGENARTVEACRKAYATLDADDDDSLRQVVAAFSALHTADEAGALPLAGLAEADALWADHLKDDAHRATDAAHADALRKEAQAKLDEAKRWSTEALTAGVDDPDVNRAMATYLLAGGAPASQVDAYLKRAVNEHHPEDAASAWVRGAVALRDGRTDEARTQLEHANALAQAATHKDLVRADVLLAEIAATAGHGDEAKALVGKVLADNPAHARAKAIEAALAAPPPAPVAATATPPAGTATATATPPPAAATATPPATAPTPVKAAVAAALPPPSPTTTAPEKKERAEKKPVEVRGGYEAEVAEGNRLLERGRGKEALKLFEKALEERPDGVEALTGLGYCQLDTEHLGAATDTFKRALTTAPTYGEAIIGLAEAYKIRGNKEKALEYYRKYVSDVPGGSKMGMAKKNVEDLESAVGTAGTGDAPQ